MEKVLKLDGVEVIYLHEFDVFEVWAMVADGPDDCMWDVVGEFDSSGAAVDAAQGISKRMELI